MDDRGVAHHEVLVVGAGFAGLYLLHRLRGLGFDTHVLEMADDVGGTWYWNAYPGARCDVESVDYSYTFSPELDQEWVWTERYAGQREILSYVRHVADRLDLRRDVEFGVAVTGAVWDEGDATWSVTARGHADGVARTLTCRYLVMATGALSVANEPSLPGREAFAGRIVHTARWPHEGIDVTGLRVGVIGTGSSGIQSIPVLARQAAHLTVFQRHPQFTVPAFNGALAPETLAEVKSGYPDRREAMRKTSFGVVLPIPEKKALEVDEETRQTVYERGWQRGSLNGVIGAFKDLIFNREANETAAQFVREKIRSIVADPDLAEALCPDEPFGGRRLCLDTGFYETFNRDNVSLVDLRKDPLVRLTADGVETESGHHRLDLLVLATGFDAMTGALTAIDPVGVDGVPLRATWADGAHAYLGLMVAGYPNLFTVTGPGSPSVFANMIVAIEQHGNWIGDCLVRLRDHGLRRIEADVDAERAWMIHVDEVARPRLRYKTNSWYSGANIEGKPRVFLPYAGGLNVYGEKIDAVAANGYEGFHLS